MLTILLYILCAVVTLFILLLVVGYFVLIGRPVYCKSRASMNGKVVLITGANSGIGKETAVDLAKRGARVICASRNSLLGEKAVKEIQEICGHSNVVYKQLDLSDFDSVNKFAQWVIDNEPKLDVLINNAGHSLVKEKSKYGYYLVFTTNHLGPFLLTYRLLDLLRKSAPSRIINVSSIAHGWAGAVNGLNFTPGENNEYPKLRRYDRSKLANVLHARHLTKLLKGTGVTANSLHPGAVGTNIWEALNARPWPKFLIEFTKSVIKFVMWTPEQGAQTTIHLAVAEELETVSGRYFDCCKQKEESKAAQSDEMAEQLWDVSLKMCGVQET